MSVDGPPYEQRKLRGIDSNSLLRLYDQASAVLDRSPSQIERARADKAVQRITKELQKRDVRFTARRRDETGPAPAVPGPPTLPR